MKMASDANMAYNQYSITDSGRKRSWSVSLNEMIKVRDGHTEYHVFSKSDVIYIIEYLYMCKLMFF